MSLFFGAYTQFFDGDGNPLAGAKLAFYEAGTTTPKATYTSYTLATPNANPVVADASGRFGAIWLLPSLYKAVLLSAADSVLWTADYVSGDVLNILTTRGDLLTRNASAYIRLARGSAGQALTSNGSDLVWATIPSLTATNTFVANEQILQSNDASASPGPTLRTFRNSASPASGDFIGSFSHDFRNASGTQRTASNWITQVTDPVNATEDAQVIMQVIRAGSLTNMLSIGAGLAMEGATSGQMGAGTINATDYYRNGVLFPVAAQYTSGELTISSAGSHSLTHGLGAAPKIVALTAICKSAEHGYSVNDVISLGGGQGLGTDRISMALRLTSSQINLRYSDASNPLSYVHFSTGASVALTNASWRVIVRAFN